jgi:hypothetical protein
MNIIQSEDTEREKTDLLERIHLRDACKEAALVVFEQTHARVFENAFLSHSMSEKKTAGGEDG